MNDDSLVSVVVPCYNGGRFVAEAVQSVLDQSHAAVEIIVVDDGSTDNSPDILATFGNKIRVIRQENHGLSDARNVGIESSRGTYLAFLDADDYWDHTFVEKMVSALDNSSAAIAYCGWKNLGLNGPRGEPFIPPDYEAEEKVESLLRYASLWPVHAAMLKRSILEEAGGFDTHLPACEDYDLWLRLAVKHRIVRIPEVLAYYRHHGEAQMTSKQWMQAKYLLQIKKAFVSQHPELYQTISPVKLKSFLSGALLQRAYDCYWRRDLLSAQKIFRMAIRAGGWKFQDLKYLLPSLLPKSLYLSLIQKADKRGTLDSESSA